METSLPTPICQGQQVNLPEGMNCLGHFRDFGEAETLQNSWVHRSMVHHRSMANHWQSLHLPQQVAKQSAHTRISSALHKTKHKNM